MTNDPVYKHFVELSWRRKLSPADEVELSAWLQSHPEAQAAWESEAGLNDVLDLLPEAPLANNFSARVMQQVEREKAAQLRHTRRGQLAWWRRWIPRIALTIVVAAAGALSYVHFHGARIHAEMDAARVRAEVVQGLGTISQVPSLPAPDILEDFDTIRLLSPWLADEKLLTLLQ